MSLAPNALRKLSKELVKLQRSPPDGIGIEVGEGHLLDVEGWIRGPAGTPYEGGFFRVGFNFNGVDFPASPPLCTMKTKIFHPNVSSKGEICVSTLKKDWSSSYGLEHILVVIKCLLISPNPDSALDPDAGRLLQEAYEDYAYTARVWTKTHAFERPGCLPLTESELAASKADEEMAATAAATAAEVGPPPLSASSSSNTITFASFGEASKKVTPCQKPGADVSIATGKVAASPMLSASMVASAIDSKSELPQEASKSIKKRGIKRL
ncbi:UBC-like protein [Acaromyces ingoldii]|uniref:E2 ubiquitin-conjugating enzyme n=1 Tax=Acaromyces ingoldii TaxID=215250 RepID=A0A316YLP9_9BASI|nr:UBC-like protein [Acaromyces ingoldii]PWN90307.1 UBC-like protein [Acaromyces ingoldii]